MEFLTLLVEKAIVIVPALYIIGEIIRKVEVIPNKYIPAILLVPGIIGTMAIIGWDVPGAIQGILATGGAVFSDQVAKQYFNKDGGA